MVVHAIHPSTWEAEPEDHEFKDSLGYIARTISGKSKTRHKPNIWKKLLRVPGCFD
jgi:hypothetical protein